MRNSPAAALVTVSVLLLSSCGGEDREALVIPADRLDAALLTIDDFDDEWTQEQRAVFLSREEGPQAFESTGWCSQAGENVAGLDTLQDLDGDTGAAVEFRHERQESRRMFQGISQQVWSNEDVPAYFDLMSNVFQTCAGETWSPEPDQNVSISDYEVLDLGDDSLSVNVTIATPGPDGTYLWSSRLVIVVIDSTLMILRELDVQLEGEEPLMSTGAWNQLVDVAMGHFSGVVGMTSAEGGFFVTDPFFADVTPAVPIG